MNFSSVSVIANALRLHSTSCEYRLFAHSLVLSGQCLESPVELTRTRQLLEIPCDCLNRFQTTSEAGNRLSVFLQFTIRKIAQMECRSRGAESGPMKLFSHFLLSVTDLEQFTYLEIYLTKKISITEHVTFRFNTQMFSVFNHPNFALPGNNQAGIPGSPATQTAGFEHHLTAYGIAWCRTGRR